MNRTLVRAGLIYESFAFAAVGFWAAFAPHSFYGDFPGGGRHWVSMDGPYNEHLVRDVGELSLAIFVVVLAAAITLSLPLVRTALAAVIVNGGLHLVYHARHLDTLSSGDGVAVIASLALGPAVAVVLLILTARPAPTVEPRPEYPVRD
ncbi:MAG: hypothetical protein JJE46_10155 [Acidimicrobiia bacterium]|nr:hypothetical protein [Acidimicrobiia bacterium]